MSALLAEATDQALAFSLRDYNSAPVKKFTTVAATPIDMYGWDTVFAIRLPDVNTAIAKYATENPGRIPTSWAESMQFGSATISGAGPLQNWRLVSGGDGTTVRMAIDLPSGTVTLATGGQTPVDYPFTQGVVTFLVNLQFIPRAGAAQGPITNDLQVTNTISGVQVNFNSPSQPDQVVTDAMPQLMQKWLLANLSAFEFVFASVNLNTIADHANWQWLMPTSTAYAYKQRGLYAEDQDCFLGVLCTTNGRSSTNLQAALDTAAVPDGARAGFVLGATAFLENVMWPRVAQAFDGAAQTDFAMSPNSDGTYSLHNVNEVKMTIQNKDFTVPANNFIVTIGAGDLVSQFIDIKHNVSPGIDLYLNYKAKTSCTLQAQSGGTQALVLEDDGDVEFSNRVETAPGVEVTKIVLGAILGVLMAVLGEAAGSKIVTSLIGRGVFSFTAESLPARLLTLLFSSIVSITTFSVVFNVPDYISADQARKADDLPPFNPFVDAATNSIQWPSAGEAQLQTVMFNNGLVIGVDPLFAESGAK
jgi:hypothetical protein